MSSVAENAAYTSCLQLSASVTWLRKMGDFSCPSIHSRNTSRAAADA